MVENKCRISISPELYADLEERCKAEYGLSVSHYARMLLHRMLHAQTGIDRDGKRIYELELEDADEIEAYAKAKRYGSVADFARIAMEQSISRHPLSEAQKARVGKTSAEGNEGA